MKAKTNSIIAGFLFAVFISLLAVVIAVVPKGVTTVDAATDTKYTVMFDYELSYHARSNYGNNDYVAMSGTDVAAAEVNYHGRETTNYSILLSGSAISASGVLQNGGFVTSNSVTIEMVSDKYSTGTISVRDESNQVVANASGKSVTVSGLSEGTYNVLLLHSYSNSAGLVTAWFEMSAKFQFRYDSTAPIITGASISQTGMYTNTAFNVKASDTGSEVDSLYMQAPDSSIYQSVGTSVTIPKGSVNGLYKFYATDRAKNKSQTHYVNFDDTSPTITCNGASFGTDTNEAFTVMAEDNSSGVKLYYKKDYNTWKTDGSSCAFAETAEDGIYYFFAEDAYGNATSEKWITVGQELSGEFIKSENDNTAYFTWKRASWIATLDGEDYAKGTWITQEGKHTVKLQSTSKSAVFSYTVDHNYLTKMQEPTCTTAGYILNECSQCGATYSNYFLEETGHYYVASTIAPTCTNGGYTEYSCTRCGDSYTDNYTHPLGHNYKATYQAATCTDYGKTMFTCQVCGIGYYETDGTYPTGHNYTNIVITAPTCLTNGVRRSICDECGDTYDTIIPANGHNYSITDTTSTNDIITRIYTCNLCGHSYKEELGNQYDEVSNYIEYLFLQYSPYMWWILLAAAGLWSVGIGVAIAIAHKNEEKEKAKKMLVNYVIGLVVIAVIVVACPYLIRGIAALI